MSRAGSDAARKVRTAEIVDLGMQGRTAKSIAESLGVTVQLVYMIFRKYGVGETMYRERPRHGLTDRTVSLLHAVWPHMTNDQRDRFAQIAANYRELKSELMSEHAQRLTDNSLAAQIPYFGVGLRDSSAALTAAQGESTREGTTPGGKVR